MSSGFLEFRSSVLRETSKNHPQCDNTNKSTKTRLKKRWKLKKKLPCVIYLVVNVLRIEVKSPRQSHRLKRCWPHLLRLSKLDRSKGLVETRQRVLAVLVKILNFLGVYPNHAKKKVPRHSESDGNTRVHDAHWKNTRKRMTENKRVGWRWFEKKKKTTAFTYGLWRECRWWCSAISWGGAGGERRSTRWKVGPFAPKRFGNRTWWCSWDVWWD